MGWSWAVYLAEAALRDIVEDPPNLKEERARRLIEGAASPEISQKNSSVNIE